MTTAMPLPILHDVTEPTPQNLVRLFHRTELHWVRHLGEETQLDSGVAFTNAELPGVWDANLVIDAALPQGTSPEAAVAEVDAHFSAAGTRCLQWLMNPSAPAEQVAPLVEYLLAQDWEPRPYDVMHLSARAAPASPEAPGLTVIPARASFRHARSLAEEAAACWAEPQLADASMLHLDDPHWDVSIALRDGRAVARAGVLAVGDIGRIEHVFVSAGFRRQGIGRTMVQRVLEVCARSLFKHVMLSVPPDETPAVELYTRLGFRRIGQIVPYRRRAAG
jgi:ribosomal protein S18 acetylase RimI-like enzyme